MNQKTEEPPHNFLVVSLCDNDYGHTIRDAITEIFPKFHSDTPLGQWKLYIIAFVLGESLKRQVLIDQKLDLEEPDLDRTQQYLDRNMRMSYEKHAPKDDHDNGSCCFDFHNENGWTY